ncbi:hypothetical protein D9757_001200 [Collybiopsis confluens]|uniref:DUF6535 domain-containing protein n=1 Tax=Collybiopsis confluens TaxID=2823264 RepID=A0A8H5MGE3_9AGAR|nr:hypothetical protein D9757_001200 [Collybiopsis confluens]
MVRKNNYHSTLRFLILVFNADDDYEQKFPEDPIFRKMGQNARVWRTYLAESAVFDENMIGEAREGLDAMLVFLVSQQSIGTTGNVNSPFAFDTASKFVPDLRDVWINGLWVVSLTFSLVAALAWVLIKQWLRRYLAFHSGTPPQLQAYGLRNLADLDYQRFFYFMVLGFRRIQLFCYPDTGPMRLPLSLDDLEWSAVESAVENVDDPLSVHAHWLFTTSTNTSVHSIVMQAMGGLPGCETTKQALNSRFNFQEDCQPVLEHLISSCTESLSQYSVMCFSIPHLESVLERLCRTLLFFPPPKGILSGQDYLDHILKIYSTRHHVFIWEAIFKNASDRVAIGYKEREYPVLEVHIMAVAKRPEYTTLIYSWMLQMLASHDLHPHLLSSDRIVEAMLQFLLRHLWDEELSEDKFWEYLKNVFKRFDVIQADQRFHEDDNCDFTISSFIVQLSEKFMSNPLLAEKVRIYWTQTQSKPIGALEKDMICLPHVQYNHGRLETTDEVDRERLKRKIGADLPLSLDCPQVRRTIQRLDDYLAETQDQHEVRPVCEIFIARQQLKIEAKNTPIIPGSSGPQELDSAMDTQSPIHQRTPTLLRRKLWDRVQGIGKRNTEKGALNVDSLPVATASIQAPIFNPYSVASHGKVDVDRSNFPGPQSSDIEIGEELDLKIMQKH